MKRFDGHPYEMGDMLRFNGAPPPPAGWLGHTTTLPARSLTPRCAPH